jgi:hypothetical protein
MWAFLISDVETSYSIMRQFEIYTSVTYEFHAFSIQKMNTFLISLKECCSASADHECLNFIFLYV